MFCSNCAQAVPATGDDCPRCGAPTAPPHSARPALITPPQPNDSLPQYVYCQSQSNPTLSGSITLGLGLACGFTLFFLIVLFIAIVTLGLAINLLH